MPLQSTISPSQATDHPMCCLKMVYPIIFCVVSSPDGIWMPKIKHRKSNMFQMVQFRFKLSQNIISFGCHETCSRIHASRSRFPLWGPKICQCPALGEPTTGKMNMLIDLPTNRIQGTYIHDVDQLVDHLPNFVFPRHS